MHTQHTRTHTSTECVRICAFYMRAHNNIINSHLISIQIYHTREQTIYICIYIHDSETFASDANK